VNIEGGIPHAEMDAKASVRLENKYLLDSIMLLSSKGCSIRMIASELCVSKSKVHRILQHLSIPYNNGSGRR